jgi:hypothetical protein
MFIRDARHIQRVGLGKIKVTENGVMSEKLHSMSIFAFGGLGTIAFLATAISAVMAACNDPTGFTVPGGPGGNSSKSGSSSSDLSQTFNEDCPADNTWIPADGGLPPPVPMVEPAPHPDTECPFYRGAYENFMIVGHPKANGDPALVDYATLDDTFASAFASNPYVRNSGTLDPAKSADPCVNSGGAAGAATARTGAPTGRAWLGVIRQAGHRNVLVDQDRHTLYYGLHMNQAFVDFVKANNLATASGILAVDPNLAFPPGVTEFKTAWKDIDPRDFPDSSGKLCNASAKVPSPTDFPGDPGDYSNYITTMAWIPWLTQDPATGQMIEDADHPVLRKVALVAIHCVYTLPGHPEFVWGSVQHVNTTLEDNTVFTFAGVHVLGMPDSQPDSISPDGGPPALPDPNDPQNMNNPVPPGANHHYLLYANSALESVSNSAPADLMLGFDEPTQTFGNANNVFRVFPGSKADKLSPDTAVFSLNSNLNDLYGGAIEAGVIDPGVDKRVNYRLVAAVWMDKPAVFGLGVKDPTTQLYPGLTFQNDDGTNILVNDATGNKPNVHPEISQGVSCGTPTGTNGHPPLSGDVPDATAYSNTVPGCDTRADELNLPGANNPARGEDGGIMIADPLGDFASHAAGTDSPFSILGGEDRLSSTSMETFTQNDTFHNCFSCHNTFPTNADGVAATDPNCLPPNSPTNPACPVQTVMPFAAKINVSHMFSEFLIHEREAAKKRGLDAGF